MIYSDGHPLSPPETRRDSRQQRQRQDHQNGSSGGVANTSTSSKAASGTTDQQQVSGGTSSHGLINGPGSSPPSLDGQSANSSPSPIHRVIDEDIVGDSFSPLSQIYLGRGSSSAAEGVSLDDPKAVYSPDAPGSLLKDKNSFMLTYRNIQVEHTYLVTSSHNRGSLTWVACFVGPAFIASPLLSQDHRHWTGYLNFAIGSAILFLGIVNGIVFARHSKTATFDSIVRAVKGNEMLSYVMYFLTLSLCVAAYPLMDLCIEHVLRGENQLTVQRCHREIYPFTVLIQVLPILFLEFLRAGPAAIVALLVPVVLFSCRSLAPIDPGRDLAVKVVVNVFLTILFVATIRYNDVSQRKRFELEVKLVRNREMLRRNREKIDSSLRLLMPETVVAKMVKGEAPLDYSPQCSVVVTQIHDFARWSCTVLPALLVKIVDNVFCMFDNNVSAKFKADKIKVVGDVYVAACGLWPTRSSLPRNDTAADGSEAGIDSTQGKSSAECVLEFAAFQMRTAKRLAKMPFMKDFGLKSGAHSGTCFGFLALSTSLWYDIGGPAYEIALALSAAAGPTEILASPECLASSRGNFVGARETVVPLRQGTAEHRGEVAVFAASPQVRRHQRLMHSDSSRSMATESENQSPSLSPNRHPSLGQLSQVDLTFGLDIASGAPSLVSAGNSSVLSMHSREEVPSSTPRSSVTHSSAEAIDATRHHLLLKHVQSMMLFEHNNTVGQKDNTRNATEDTTGEHQHDSTIYDSVEGKTVEAQLNVDLINFGESFFGHAEATAIHERLQSATFDKWCACTVAFEDPEIETQFRTYARQRFGRLHRRVVWPSLLLTVLFTFLVVAAEGVLNPAGTALMLANTVMCLLWLAAVHRWQDSSPTLDVILACISYTLMFASFTAQRTSILSGGSGWLQIPAMVHLLYVGMRGRWYICAFGSLWLAGVTMASHFVLFTDRAPLGIFVYAPLFGFYGCLQAHRGERTNRLLFKDRYISQLFVVAAQNELKLQRTMLTMVVPRAIVDVVIEKSAGTRSAIIETLGEVVIGMIRVDDLHSLSQNAATPLMAMYHTEGVLREIENLCVATRPGKCRSPGIGGGALIEKVHTLGDVVLIAGPITERPRLKLPRASTVGGGGGAVPTSVAAEHEFTNLGSPIAAGKRGTQLLTASQREHLLAHLQEDSVLRAAVALLDIVLKLTASPHCMTVVLHCGSAFAAVLGTQRPSFSLMGPVTRTAEALIEASPAGSVSMTDSYQRLLGNGRVTLPRFPGDFTCLPSLRCKLRGAGIIVSLPLRKSRNKEELAS